MHVEDGLTYCFQFKQGGRIQAAKLAYDLDFQESKKSNLKHVVCAAKAFFSRQVTIASESLKKPELQHLTKKLTGDIRNKNIRKVTTTAGVDPIRKRGDAQSYTRQTVIRTWPYKSLKHPGHASLSIKDSSSSRERPKHVYLSWWPAKKIKSKFNSFLKRINMGDLSVKVAGTNSSYKMDKREEISARTQARLVSGAGNHDDLKGYDYFSDAVIEEAKVSPIQPRPRQVPLRDTRLWGMQADKVYVPLIGPNAEIEGNRAAFTLFGLNEFKMENFARQRYRDAQDEKAFYGLVSPDDSCSGVILNTLRHGGADYYTKTDDALLVTDPNLLHKISIRLQNRIDGLNRKAEFLSSQLILLSRSESSGFPGKNSTDKSLQLKSAVDHLKQTIRSSKTPNKVRDHLQRVRACLKDFNNAKCSLDDLTPKAIKFVEALYKSCDSCKDVEQHLLMFKPALEAFEVIKELVTEACSEESFNSIVSDIPIISF